MKGHDPATYGHKVGLGLFAAAGILFAILGLPGLVAAWILLPGDATLLAIHVEMTVETERLQGLAERQRKALEWTPGGRRWTELGLTWVLLSERAQSTRPENDAASMAAAAAFRRGLALAPANAFAWTRLAVTRLDDHGIDDEAVRAFSMALRTAPYDPRLTFPRLALGIALWPYLAREDRSRLLTQFRHGWRDDPVRLIAMASETGAEGLVHAALVRDPADWKAFRRRYERQR